MRVCCISHCANLNGGAQRSLLDLFDALMPEGVKFHAIVPAPGPLTALLDQRGVPYQICPFHFWATFEAQGPLWQRLAKKPLQHLGRSAALAKAIRRWQCDLVLSNTLTFCEGALAARMLGLPHVTHVREFGDLDHGLHFEYGAERQMRLLAALSRRVVFNSAAVAQRYERQVSVSKRRVVFNACAVPDRYRQPRASGHHASELCCVMASRIADSKGQAEAAGAIEILAQRGVAVRLRLIGEGESPALDRAVARLAERGVADRVERCGHLAQPFEAIRQADVALVCSRMEAFGRVTVEAMKLGLPVIGAASGGTTELIRDGFNGLLYRPGDSADLADKIAHLAVRRDLVAAMGRQAQEWARESFSLERYGGDMLAILEDAIGKQP